MCPNNATAYDQKLPGPPMMQVPMPMAQFPPAGAVPGQWTTGLCGCFEDPSNCVITCCCPCITFGQNAEIIDRGATCWVANAEKMNQGAATMPPMMQGMGR
ncbi:hypothetical protein NL676_029287 [Syzygium grande]|nr:hypothetical protein NL676_029287 [Syzygium grande]